MSQLSSGLHRNLDTGIKSKVCIKTTSLNWSVSLQYVLLEYYSENVIGVYDAAVLQTLHLQIYYTLIILKRMKNVEWCKPYLYTVYNKVHNATFTYQNQIIN